jgi:5-methylcytosine-specific restriction enzyme subunit McrC
MKAIITFEHSCLTAADFDDGQDFDWLIEQNFDVFRIERKQQQWQLKVRHYIGVIGLPSGGQVEILPKLPQAQITHADEVTQTRQWVQQMLTAVWQALLPKSLPNLANQRLINPLAPNPPPINHSLSLSEWLQAYFWQGFAQYVPNQQYQQFEQNQPYLQGKLLIKQQLQHNCHQPHKFYHQSENFVMDTAGNRLVKTTIERVIGSMASSPLSSPLLPQWQAVDIVAKDLYDILFSQALQELTALPSLLAKRNYTFISFCYALLTLQQASSQGQFLTPTWLVNMPFAFEKWVGRKIQQQFAAQNFELVEQKKTAIDRVT